MKTEIKKDTNKIKTNKKDINKTEKNKNKTEKNTNKTKKDINKTEKDNKILSFDEFNSKITVGGCVSHKEIKEYLFNSIEDIKNHFKITDEEYKLYIEENIIDEKLKCCIEKIKDYLLNNEFNILNENHYYLSYKLYISNSNNFLIFYTFEYDDTDKIKIIHSFDLDSLESSNIYNYRINLNSDLKNELLSLFKKDIYNDIEENKKTLYENYKRNFKGEK